MTWVSHLFRCERLLEWVASPLSPPDWVEIGARKDLRIKKKWKWKLRRKKRESPLSPPNWVEIGARKDLRNKKSENNIFTNLPGIIEPHLVLLRPAVVMDFHLVGVFFFFRFLYKDHLNGTGKSEVFQIFWGARRCFYSFMSLLQLTLRPAMPAMLATLQYIVLL